MSEEDPELQGVIKRIVSRIITEPASFGLLERLKAYGSPEKFLVWWLNHMRQDFQAYARTLTNKELADSLDYNAPYAKSDIMRSVMEEAAKRLRGDQESLLHYATPPPRNNPPLNAYATPDEA
ncbi:MAG TPA: hypothetical protein VL614_15885 [Acetobacteraceae bacterium]|nr:hypothetical protein [Acetobacteraceae bacterium]